MSNTIFFSSQKCNYFISFFFFFGNIGKLCDSLAVLPLICHLSIKVDLSRVENTAYSCRYSCFRSIPTPAAIIP